MYLKKIHLENFRCYEKLDMDLDPSFNVIVGVNGTGKTAVLDAIRVSIGSLFLNIDKYKGKISSPLIANSDIRLSHLEQQYPVKIAATGIVDNKKEISWERSIKQKDGKTLKDNAKEMGSYSELIQTRIRANNTTDYMPLVAYYTTDRFKKEINGTDLISDGSRLRGYFNSVSKLTNIKFFLDLYKTETLSALQHSTKSSQLIAVTNAVKGCVSDCKTMYHDVKRGELILELNSSHDLIPFSALSDGVRSILSLVMEIAFRCCILNPSLKENAALGTPGIVLIDEIDLHLHPAWQKKVIGDLRKAFPKMQFIVSTHAPLVIGSLTDGKIFSISDNVAYDFPLQYGRDANAILNEMGTSEMEDTLKTELNQYFLLIEAGHGNETKALALRAVLEKKLGVEHTELQRANMMLSFF